MRSIIVKGITLTISENGEVFNARGKRMAQYTDKYGYKYIVSREHHKRTKIMVHRLVAMAYLPEIEEKTQINHKDGDKANNNVKNLEWVTNAENQTHSRYVLNNETGFKDVPVRCIETKAIFRSTREAWRNMGISYCHISECVNGKRKTAGGYHWERV